MKRTLVVLWGRSSRTIRSAIGGISLVQFELPRTHENVDSHDYRLKVSILQEDRMASRVGNSVSSSTLDLVEDPRRDPFPWPRPPHGSDFRSENVKEESSVRRLYRPPSSASARADGVARERCGTHPI